MCLTDSLTRICDSADPFWCRRGSSEGDSSGDGDQCGPSAICQSKKCLLGKLVYSKQISDAKQLTDHDLALAVGHVEVRNHHPREWDRFVLPLLVGEISLCLLNLQGLWSRFQPVQLPGREALRQVPDQSNRRSSLHAVLPSANVPVPRPENDAIRRIAERNRQRQGQQARNTGSTLQARTALHHDRVEEVTESSPPQASQQCAPQPALEAAPSLLPLDGLDKFNSPFAYVYDMRRRGIRALQISDALSQIIRLEGQITGYLSLREDESLDLLRRKQSERRDHLLDLLRTIFAEYGECEKVEDIDAAMDRLRERPIGLAGTRSSRVSESEPWPISLHGKSLLWLCVNFFLLFLLAQMLLGLF